MILLSNNQLIITINCTTRLTTCHHYNYHVYPSIINELQTVDNKNVHIPFLYYNRSTLYAKSFVETQFKR